MKIERIHLQAFGRLKELDTGPERLPGLVVVLGPNEAGKSTVFHFLTSLLYGFYPASRDSHPYAPWDGSDPAGAMTLELDGGGCVEVERRLRSQPSGRMTVAGRAEDLRNRTLPWAEHVPRQVFLQVFALSLEELAGLDANTWAGIQDRIVGSMGAADVLPARQVISDLEQAAGELWRPSRRGNQRIRDIRAAVLELRERRRSSGERDRSLRDMVAELDRVRDELKGARRDRNRARLAVERVHALIPIRTQLQRIAGLREDAGPAGELENMPADPSAELARRRRRVEDLSTRLDEIRAELVEPQAALDAVGDEERGLLARTSEITALVARVAGVRGDRARLAALEQEIRDLQRRIEAQAGHLLRGGWDPELEPALAALPTAEVRERVRRARSTAEEVRILEAAASRAASPPAAIPGGLFPGGVGLLLVGAVLLVMGIPFGGALLLVSGSACAAVGLALLALWTHERLRARSGSVVPAATKGSVDDARTAVGDALGGIPVIPGLLTNPDETLVVGLERLQELLRDRRDRVGTATGLRDSMEEATHDARALARDLALEEGGDAEAIAHLLEQAVRRAERLSQAAAAALREVKRLEREEDRLRAEAETAAAALSALEQDLAEAGAGDLAAGIRSVRDRIHARDRADQLEDELERAHPDLEEIRGKIRKAEEGGDSWTVDDDDLARRKAQVEELTERVESLATRAEALDRDIAHLQKEETMDAVDGEIASLQQEESLLLRERDRLWALAQLLREADRRFREEHQPDVLRRAGDHLAALSGGRYDRIAVDEAAGNGAFQLAGPALAKPVALAHPISTGTLEQAYLALRLAIVDHLDQGLEKLPMFVDEVLVNWDDRRRKRGVDLLGALSRHRQIFVFTCHRVIAEELQEVGARLLEVDAGRRG